MPSGAAVDCITLSAGALRLSALNYGAIITSLRMLEHGGTGAELVLGFDALDPYLDDTAYLGALVGRCANRIAASRFELDGTPHQLATNDGAHHLHGGRRGFSRQMWDWAPLVCDDSCGIRFSRISPAGEVAYPGTLQVEVCYRLTTDGRVLLDYTAQTDAPTVVNLIQHTYFNLAGELSTNVLGHELTLHARSYTPIGPGLIPTGAIADVEGTPFDFTIARAILEQARHPHPQLVLAGGFDHNVVLDRSATTPALAAVLRDPRSGRTLRLLTSEPGLQFYDGHLLDGRAMAAHQRLLVPHAGLCLEPQHFPDSPNQPRFPSTVLRPGETYRSSTVWELSVT